MTHNQLSAVVIDAALEIHRRLGPGLLESVYQEILLYELRKRGLRVEKELPIPVIWDDVKLDVGFRADLIVENLLIVELKSIEAIAPVHKKILFRPEVLRLQLLFADTPAWNRSNRGKPIDRRTEVDRSDCPGP